MEEVSALSTILTDVGTIISSLTQWMTSLTTWVLGDTLARMFFAIMFIMLALHVIKSLIAGA